MIKWIKPSERLPKESEKCLVFYSHDPLFDRGEILMSYWYKGGWCRIPDWDDLKFDGVLFWAELNEPEM